MPTTTKKPDDTKAAAAFAEYVKALKSIRNPTERYLAAVEAEDRWDARAKITAIKDAAALEMADTMSLAEIAQVGGFSRACAQQIVNRAKQRLRKSGASYLRSAKRSPSRRPPAKKS